MKLSELMKQELICLDLKSTEKVDVIREMADILVQTGRVADRESFLESVFEREKLGSTGIGSGVAVPHARTETVREIHVAFGRSQTGVKFESFDDKTVHLVFLIASPTGKNELYLRTLARLSCLLRETKFRQALLLAETAEEVLLLLGSSEKR